MYFSKGIRQINLGDFSTLNTSNQACHSPCVLMLTNANANVDHTITTFTDETLRNKYVRKNPAT